MKKHSLFNFIYFYLHFIFFANTIFALEFKDRLVVSIKNISYSQRHVELYIYIREALREKQPDISHFKAMDQAMWHDALTLFISDIKLLQEQQRLSVYTPPKRGLVKARERVEERLKDIPEFSTRMKILTADDESTQKILQQILSVEFFRETRLKKNPAVLTPEAPAEVQSENLFVRLYDRAFVYIPISNRN